MSELGTTLTCLHPSQFKVALSTHSMPQWTGNASASDVFFNCGMVFTAKRTHCDFISYSNFIKSSCILRRRRRGTMLKQQLHAKTYHQCQFVCSGCNTCNSSVWRNFFSVYKRKACTVRAFDNVPTCLHHCVMTVHVSHHNPLCSPSLMGESANAATDTAHCETFKHLQLRIRVKQKHCSSFAQTKKQQIRTQQSSSASLPANIFFGLASVEIVQSL